MFVPDLPGLPAILKTVISLVARKNITSTDALLSYPVIRPANVNSNKRDDADCQRAPMLFVAQKPARGNSSRDFNTIKAYGFGPHYFFRPPFFLPHAIVCSFQSESYALVAFNLVTVLFPYTAQLLAYAVVRIQGPTVRASSPEEVDNLLVGHKLVRAHGFEIMG